MHPEDNRNVIDARISLEDEFEKRLNVTDLIKDKIKNLTSEGKFAVLTSLYSRYYEYGRIMRNIKLMVGDILMTDSQYNDTVLVSDNITGEYLSKLIKENKITAFQAIAYANYHLDESEQRNLFGEHYDLLKPFKKGIHYFVLKDSKPV